MRARARATSAAAIGAMIGLAVAALTAVAPASAAKPQPGSTQVTATYSCGSFHGLTVTADSVSRNSVGLKAGEVIGVTVSPAREGDMIILTEGFTFYDAPAISGLQFRAPSDGTYNFGWSLDAAGTRPSSLTWSFTCSSGSGSGSGTGTGTVTSDADRDGVADSADACSGTTLPDSVSRKAAGMYYALSNGRFVDGAGKTSAYTVVDTGGCSATQIAKSLGLNKRDSRSGITLTTLSNWAATH
jgi:hypothetical protein